ncbi:MAG: primase-like DNA-binding domain-containing protein, partial [Gemmatimonadota bacterium]|nr:primase-like DNA-binding domain-containing protein [Gemmatimonadota bacterium]
LEWQRDGLGTAEEVQRATADYREEMDALGAFLRDRCEQDPSGEVGATELYRNYVDWCDVNGERSQTQTKFGLKLTERGFSKSKNRNGIHYLGITLVKGVNSREGFSDNSPSYSPHVGTFQERVHNRSHSSQEPEDEAA